MATPLHVVLYHPDRLPVAGYGGTERVVVWLARGLATLGHRVTLLAAPGSRISEATTIEIPRRLAHAPGGPDLSRWIPADADVLHAHVPLHHPPTQLPYLWTYHGVGTLPPALAANAIGLSRDHAMRHQLDRWVHNGLDPADYLFAPTKQRWDLFLGRLHSVKGWRWAVDGARRSNRTLVVAGGWRPTLHHDVRYVGKVGGRIKRELLASAAALWMPAQWDEPFGLTTIEAMVSGTPVLATPRGALPEIITEHSGRMGSTLEEMITLREEMARLDPEAVRANVLERFTHVRMAEDYVRMYRAA